MKRKTNFLLLIGMIFILVGCNVMKSKEDFTNDEIKKDAFIMYNPKKENAKSIETYKPSMADELFENTYAYKIYEKNKENLSKTRDILMEECVDYANNLYFIFSSDLEKIKKNKGSLRANLTNENGEESIEKSLYETQLLAICDTSSKLYYAINDLKVVNDLMGNSYDDLKIYAKDFIEKNGESLLDDQMKNFGFTYNDKAKETIENLIISYLDEFKKDLPHKDGDKTNIKIEKEVKLSMEKLEILKYFDDLEKAVRKVYKED
ncbi:MULTISPECIES: hypothetical protein [Anaerococcus]|uniref:hypothetical protein n=1 Tax=Anaerococcus TaxID=165779 RepID=UPI002431371F|nr:MULTISPECIES: hypothetical protein [Anaerococcus]MDD7767021.1 hypothetical protein [Anaerococcus vaginalis]MDY6126847.1 hypothetical protein [Anaerococcus sp.]